MLTNTSSMILNLLRANLKNEAFNLSKDFIKKNNLDINLDENNLIYVAAKICAFEQNMLGE